MKKDAMFFPYAGGDMRQQLHDAPSASFPPVPALERNNYPLVGIL